MTQTTDANPEISSAALSRKMETEVAKMIAEIGRMNAETSRINRESRAFPWFPLLIAAIGNAGVTGVVAAAVLAALHR